MKGAVQGPCGEVATTSLFGCSCDTLGKINLQPSLMCGGQMGASGGHGRMSHLTAADQATPGVVGEGYAGRLGASHGIQLTWPVAPLGSLGLLAQGKCSVLFVER